MHSRVQSGLVASLASFLRQGISSHLDAALAIQRSRFGKPFLAYSRSAYYGVAMEEPENITTEEGLDPQVESAPKPKRGKGCLWGCLGCAGLFALLLAGLIGLFIWGLSSIFDEKPFDPVVRVPDQKALLTALDKLECSSAELVSGTSTSSLSTIHFNPEETNALLASLVTMSQGKEWSMDTGAVKLADAQFEQGALTAKISINTKEYVGFGGWINIQTKVIPKIKDHHMTLVVKKLVLGSLNCPPSYMESTLDDEISSFENSKSGQDLLNVVQKLEVNDEGVHITFDSQALLQYMMSGIFSQGIGI